MVLNKSAAAAAAAVYSLRQPVLDFFFFLITYLKGFLYVMRREAYIMFRIHCKQIVSLDFDNVNKRFPSKKKKTAAKGYNNNKIYNLTEWAMMTLETP